MEIYVLSQKIASKKELMTFNGLYLKANQSLFKPFIKRLVVTLMSKSLAN